MHGIPLVGLNNHGSDGSGKGWDWADRWTDMYGGVDRWMDEWTDGWMNGQMDG